MKKKKIRKYIIPKNLLNHQPNKYIFLYKREHNYIIDIKNSIFYTKISNLDAIIQNDWYEDEDINIIYTKKYFLFNLEYFNHLLANDYLKIVIITIKKFIIIL